MERTVLEGLTRRRFLVGAGAVAATPVLVRLGAALLDVDDRIDLDALGLPPLNLGYLEGSDAVAGLGGGGLAARLSGLVRPATSGRTGDQRLVGQTVRVTVHGLHPSTALARTAGAVHLDALFASHDPAEPHPFYAWTLAAGGAGAAGRRSTFVVALDRSPRFGIALAAGTGATRQTRAAVFGTGSGRQLTKLRPGAYLVPVAHDGWAGARPLPAADDPAWSSVPSVLLTIEPAAA